MKLVDSALKNADARAEQAVTPSTTATTKPAPKRQLKDYPQSLQTAARALWG